MACRIRTSRLSFPQLESAAQLTIALLRSVGGLYEARVRGPRTAGSDGLC